MAKIFPDGDGVTRSFPASLGPTAATPLWTVEYECDFGTATPATLANGVSYPVGGKSWTAQIPSGKVDNVALIDGVGLKFSFDGTDANSNLAPSDYTAPRMQISVPTLVSGLAIDDTLAFQVLLNSGGLNDNWQVYGMHLSDGTTGDNWFENSTAYESSNSDPRMRELVWYAGSCGFVSSHNQTPAFAEPLNSTGTMSGVLSSATNTVPAAAPSLNITIANATICLHAFYNNSGGGRTAYNCTFSRFRVLKRAK